MVYSLITSYHYIRSISGFKTYLIINMLNMFDLLFTSIEHVGWLYFQKNNSLSYH